jgi:putative transport protein
VQIVALRRPQHNEPASPNFVVAEDDVVLVVGPSQEALNQMSRSLGEAAPGRLVKDRRDINYLWVFASRPTVVGRALGDLDLPGEKAALVARVYDHGV